MLDIGERWHSIKDMIGTSIKDVIGKESSHGTMGLGSLKAVKMAQEI